LIDWDSNAQTVLGVGYRNRFGRFYSPAALEERVLPPARRQGFVVRLYHLANVRELDPPSGPHFGLVLVKPTSL
jgi:hypothetical protein